MRLKFFFQLKFAKFYAILTTRFRFCPLVTKGGSYNIYASLIYLFPFFSPCSQRKFASFTTERNAPWFYLSRLTARTMNLLPHLFLRESRYSKGQWRLLSEIFQWFKNQNFPRWVNSQCLKKSDKLPCECVARNTWNLASTEEIGVFHGCYVAVSGRRKVWMRSKGLRSTISWEASTLLDEKEFVRHGEICRWDLGLASSEDLLKRVALPVLLMIISCSVVFFVFSWCVSCR